MKFVIMITFDRHGMIR